MREFDVENDDDVEDDDGANNGDEVEPTVLKDNVIGSARTIFDRGDHSVCQGSNLNRSDASCFSTNELMHILRQLIVEIIFKALY